MRGWDSPIRVLHVDDDREMSDLTAEYLEREDDRFSVLTAASADEGLEVLGGTTSIASSATTTCRG